MNIDIKQYIIGVLHLEMNISLNDINSEAAEIMLSEFTENTKELNIENIRKRYFELTTNLNADESKSQDSDNTNTDEGNPLPELPSEISVKIETETSPSHPTSDNLTTKNIPGKPLVLPNAKVNENYCASLPLSENGLAEIIVLGIEGIESLGLKFDCEALQITGIPSVSGEHLLSMEYKHSSETENRPSLYRNLAIYINPDPKSMWQSFEPDPNSLFPKSHTANSEFNYHNKKIVGASKRGRSHAKDAKFRDDHYEIEIDSTSDWSLIVVSDGAGGSKYSREGSKIFCQTIQTEVFSDDNRKRLQDVENILASGEFDTKEREIKNHFYYTIGNSLIKGLRKVEEIALQNNALVKDFSCTIVVSLAKKIKNKWFIVGYWVGDGGIGVYLNDGDPIILGQPDSGEFSGQTRFITMPEILNSAEDIFSRIRLAYVDDFKALVLMTDGISDAWFHTDSNLFKREKWDALWNEIKSNQTNESELSSLDLLDWLDFWVKGEYDDRTIVILS
jgi:serine/threonine protein phosphatase PrpC